MAKVPCCVRVACPNGEGGIGETGVCNNWRWVRDVVSPLIGHFLHGRLWVHLAGKIDSRPKGVWTPWRIRDHSYHVHCICGIETRFVGIHNYAIM